MFPNITPHCKQEKFIFINITVKTLWSRIAPLAYAHVQREHAIFTHLWAFSKSKFNIKSDRVNLVAPASHIECLLYLPTDQSPRDTVQTGTGRVDPARKFKCTTAARIYTTYQGRGPSGETFGRSFRKRSDNSVISNSKILIMKIMFFLTLSVFPRLVLNDDFSYFLV